MHGRESPPGGEHVACVLSGLLQGPHAVQLAQYADDTIAPC